jgi:hypothetical protein
MRFQALMPDVLHWLGIQKIDKMVSMSNMKHVSLFFDLISALACLFHLFFRVMLTIFLPATHVTGRNCELGDPYPRTLRFTRRPDPARLAR